MFQLPEHYGSATLKDLSPLFCCPLVWDAFLTPIWVSLGPRSLPPVSSEGHLLSSQTPSRHDLVMPPGTLSLGCRGSCCS